MSAGLFLILFELLCAGIVVVRCVCVAARMSRREFTGHPLQFLGTTLGYTFIAGGAVGMVLQLGAAQWLLLAGVALWIIFDRRRRSC